MSKYNRENIREVYTAIEEFNLDSETLNLEFDIVTCRFLYYALSLSLKILIMNFFCIMKFIKMKL